MVITYPMFYPVQAIIDTFKLLVVHANEFLSDEFGTLVGYVVGISTGLAVIGAAICLIRIMASDDTNTIAQAKDDFKQVIIAWLILSFIGIVVASVMGLVNTAEI